MCARFASNPWASNKDIDITAIRLGHSPLFAWSCCTQKMFVGLYNRVCTWSVQLQQTETMHIIVYVYNPRESNKDKAGKLVY